MSEALNAALVLGLMLLWLIASSARADAYETDWCKTPRSATRISSSMPSIASRPSRLSRLEAAVEAARRDLDEQWIKEEERERERQGERE